MRRSKKQVDALAEEFESAAADAGGSPTDGGADE